MFIESFNIRHDKEPLRGRGLQKELSLWIVSLAQMVWVKTGPLLNCEMKIIMPTSPRILAQITAKVLMYKSHSLYIELKAPQ